jgi:hypothetical protein
VKVGFKLVYILDGDSYRNNDLNEVNTLKLVKEHHADQQQSWTVEQPTKVKTK